MKKILISALGTVIIIVILMILTGCGSENNNIQENNDASQISINTDNLDTDYLKSNDGTKIEFYIPEGFEETDFANKSDHWKGYNNGTGSVDLQIVTKVRADSIKNSLLQQNFKETDYTINNKTYSKIYSTASVVYIYEINDNTYYSVSDFRKTLTDDQMNTFLTIKD